MCVYWIVIRVSSALALHVNNHNIITTTLLDYVVLYSRKLGIITLARLSPTVSQPIRFQISPIPLTAALDFTSASAPPPHFFLFSPPLNVTLSPFTNHQYHIQSNQTLKQTSPCLKHSPPQMSPLTTLPIRACTSSSTQTCTTSPSSSTSTPAAQRS